MLVVTMVFYASHSQVRLGEEKAHSLALTHQALWPGIPGIAMGCPPIIIMGLPIIMGCPGISANAERQKRRCG